MSSGTFHEPLERQPYFKDKDGNVCRAKKYDDIVRHSVDWTDKLASGETVSSSAWEDGGATLSGAALATPVASVTVAGCGWVKNTVTLSTGRQLEREVRFIATDRGPSDY